ncbi:unnamed protein product [Calicophoron daubneyi]|uniref:Exocyst complex component 8 n=1 Tax=Calicophoron daubneyi TaxID=300641 RepID=A0AAV2TN54_CALDB
MESEPSDGSGLRRVFAKSNFDVDRFVRNITKDGSQSTDEMVQKLTRLSDDASSKMKKAVFENYRLFIKAGKDATHLETTMHQINSDFTEMERVMNALTEMSLFGEVLPELAAPEKEVVVAKEEGQQPAKAKLSKNAGCDMNALAEILDGVNGLPNNPSRVVVFDGDLRELSMETYSLICVAHVFLTSDYLVVAYRASGRPKSPWYQIQAAYDLNNVALVNVPARDRRHTPLNAFKLLVFPATRLFQAESLNEKQTWLRVIEDTKRDHVGSQISESSRPGSQRMQNLSGSDNSLPLKGPFLRARKSGMPPAANKPVSVVDRTPIYAISPTSVSAESAMASFKALSSTLPECADLLTPVTPAFSPTSQRKNPFDDPGDLTAGGKMGGSVSSPNAWLWDVPEDLDVAISERDFARATDTIVRARRQLDNIISGFGPPLLSTPVDKGCSATTPEKQEEQMLDSKPRSAWEKLSNRIQRNEENLTEALEYELINAADRHGAPRSICAAVNHLGQLGKSTLAAQLFLVYRSSLMAKTLTRGVRQEGNQLVYLNKLSFAFHRNLAETAAEWHKNVIIPLTSGDDRNAMKKAERLLNLRFCSWVLEETDKFSQQLRVLLIDSRSVSFHTIAHAAQRNRAHADKISQIIGVDVRAALYRGLSRAWQQAAEEQARVLRDAVEHRSKEETWDPLTSLPEPEQQGYAEELSEMGLINRRSSGITLPPLTASTYQLVRSLYLFAQSCRRFDCDELSAPFSQCIANILRAELNNYQEALNRIELLGKRPFVLLNLDFLTHQAVPRLVRHLNCMQYPEMQEVMSAFSTLLMSSSN